MPRVELKLKQASAVLGVTQKALQNFVQARVLKPRRRLGLCYFDTSLLLQATVALYLKESLGASTSYLTKFADAVARLPGFETNTPAVVRLRASAWKNDPPVEIRIPLGALAAELRRRLPLADVARDLPRGRKRLGWKRDFLASVREAAVELKGVSDRQITDAVHAYRRDRVKSVLTVAAEPDPGDAPFWTCADLGSADFIVTLNTKDFPQSRLSAKVIGPHEPLPSHRVRRRIAGFRRAR